MSLRLALRGALLGASTITIIAVTGTGQTSLAETADPSRRHNSVETGTLPTGGAAGSTTAPTLDQIARPRTNMTATRSVVPATPVGMADVERVRLRVWGQPDLGGEYAIDADSTISIPGIGRVNASALTPAEFERHLADKIATATRRDVTVSMEVVHFRPYFITGHIAEPGANEWRPGMNVLQAIASARGVMRPESTSDSEARHSLYLQSRIQLRFALAQLFRLKAERDGVEPAAISARIAALSTPSSVGQQQHLDAFINRQNNLLAEQRALQQNQLDALRHEREGATAELAAAEHQVKSAAEQYEIVSSLLKDTQGLREKQLISNSRYLQQRSDAISIETRMAESKVAVERAKGRVEALTRQIDRIQQERRATLNTGIETLEREIAELEITLAEASSESTSDEPHFSLTYQIARNTPNGMTTIPATVFTEVLPGDVVIVSGARGAAQLGLPATAAPVRTSGSSPLEQTQRMLEASSLPARTVLRSTGRAGSAPTAAR